MPQIHLHAEPGDYAPLVLLPGDPNRAKAVAAMLDGGLENTRLVNENRLLLGYTGTYKGVPVSVQTSGMGTPSFSIVMEELLHAGRETLHSHRLLAAASGAASRPATSSSPPPRCRSTAPRGRTCDGDPFAPTPDFELTRALVDTRAQSRRQAEGRAESQSVDVFYAYTPTPD